MKRNATFFVVFLLALATGAQRARAQFIGYTSPQSAQQKVFSAQTTAQTTPVATVSCTPVNGTPCGIPNIGQTVHFLTYTVAGSATTIQIRLEGSFDGSTWIPISDDATDLTKGEVVGVGYYPAVRANLVTCTGCGGAVTVTANYSGVSASPSTPSGSYNPSQQIRKVLFVQVSAGSNQSSGLVSAPYGSASGFLVLLCTGGTFPANSTVGVGVTIGSEGGGILFTSPASGRNSFGGQGTVVYPIAGQAATAVSVSYSNGGASAATVSAYYVFYPPNGSLPASAQPAQVQNSEAVSGTNAAVSTTVTVNSIYQRGHLYSVSARCSAGTAQLTVGDLATQIWSTGATEVGTTTFRYQWNPSLSSSSPISGTGVITVTLGTCGAGNTGTLDVQASVF